MKDLYGNTISGSDGGTPTDEEVDAFERLSLLGLVEIEEDKGSTDNGQFVRLTDLGAEVFETEATIRSRLPPC